MSDNNDDKNIEILDEEPKTEYVGEEPVYTEQQPQMSKDERDAKAMENFNNNAAEVAKNTNIPIAKVAGHVHSGLNKITGGKYGELTGKITAKVNKSVPGGQVAQKGANFLQKSGIGDKIGKVASMKSGKGKAASSSNASFANKRLQDRYNNIMSKKNGLQEKVSQLNANKQTDENGNKPSVAKQAASAAADKVKQKAKDKAKQAIIKFISSNPWVWIVCGAIIVILFIIIIIAGAMSDSGNGGSDDETYGLSGYEYYQLKVKCDNVYVHDTKNNEYDGTYPFEEYVAGVVAAEVGGFANDAVYEVFAIAARTFATANFESSKDCSIVGNASRQAFKKTTNEQIIKAVENTKGLILTKDGNIMTAQYDAFCFDTRDDQYYTLAQVNQKIPTSWVESHINDYGYTHCECEKPDPSRKDCYNSKGQWTDGGHGKGMSQYGAYYLATEENYDKMKLLRYYYGDDIKLMSIYRSFSYNGEYELDPNSDRYQGLTFLYNKSLEEALEENGSSFDEFNSYIKGVAQKAGVGSRAAVVNSAVSLIGSLADIGYKLPYQWGGKYYFPGAYRSWGLPASTNCDSYEASGYDKDKCLTNYRWASIDCSGFVNWSIVNGFQYSNYSEMEAAGAYQTTDFHDTISLNAEYAVCQPGDVLVNEAHIVLVVGTDDASKSYIVAESTGATIATNTGGVKLTYYSYGNTNYKCRSLDKLYKTYRSSVTSGTLLVGDSRMVGSCSAGSVCNGGTECNTDACFAKQGASITWFRGIKGKINSNTRRNVVINMGVNDLVYGDGETVADNYWKEYKEIANNNTNKRIYILSVNPTKEGASVDPSKVIAFNNRMKINIQNSGLSNVSYLDSYNNVTFNYAGDGLHYDHNTYKAIFDYVMGAI